MRVVKVTDAEGNTIRASGAQQQAQPNRPAGENGGENCAAAARKAEQLQRSLEQLRQEKKKQYDELTAQQQETQALLLTEQKRNAELTTRLEKVVAQFANAEKERTALNAKLDQAEKEAVAARQNIGELKEQLEDARQQVTDLSEQLDAARDAEQKQQAQFQQWARALEEMKKLPDGEFVQELDELIWRYSMLKMELGTAGEDLTKDSEQLRQMLTSEFADKDRLIQAAEELQQLKDAMETLQKKLCSLSSHAAHSGDERTRILYQEDGARR